MRTRHRLVVLGIGCAVALAGCAAAPRVRPVKMGPVDTGSGSVEAARRQLQGVWDLVSLDTFPTPGGAAVPVKAQAVLSYDEYGNLQMKGRLLEQTGNDRVSAAFLHYSGRAVVDVTKQQLQLMSVSGPATEGGLPDEVAFDQVRKYSIDGEMLKVSTIDANGGITATAVWKRSPR